MLVFYFLFLIAFFDWLPGHCLFYKNKNYRRGEETKTDYDKLSARDEALLQELLDVLKSPVFDEKNLKRGSEKPTSDKNTKDIKEEASQRDFLDESQSDSTVEKHKSSKDLQQNGSDDVAASTTKSDDTSKKLDQYDQNDEMNHDINPSEDVDLTTENKLRNDDNMINENKLDENQADNESESDVGNETDEENNFEENEEEDEENQQGGENKNFFDDMKIQKLQNLLNNFE